jgi:hypothetical protein
LTTPGRLKALEVQAERSYPVLVPSPDGWDGKVVHFKGRDASVYQAGVLPQGGGLPDDYLQKMLEETARGKQDSNGLSTSHPNVVVVNMLLDDLQRAHLVGQLNVPVSVSTTLDALAWGAVGIDDRISSDSLTCFRVATQSTAPWNP